MKKYFLLFIILPAVFLISCNNRIKNQAYCFSAVFERSKNDAVITLYCKTFSTSNENSGDKDIKYVLKGADFRKAIESATEKDHEIYFNSILCYCISSTLQKKDIEQIGMILLDNSKYKTDNHAYISQNSPFESSMMHEKAASISKKGSLGSSDKKDCKKTVCMFRELITK